MKCTALNECKISNISWGGGHAPRFPQTPYNAMACFHATNLSKPPHSENVVYVCVCVCVCGKQGGKTQGGKNHLTSKHVENLQHKLPSVRFTQPHPIFF